MARWILIAVLLVGSSWATAGCDRPASAPPADEIQSIGECPLPVPDDRSDDRSDDERSEPDAARTPRMVPDAPRTVIGQMRWPDLPIPESRVLSVLVPPPIA